MKMFCYQCEQAAGGRGCTSLGVCGKDAETAALQDLLVHAVKAIAVYAHRAAVRGARDAEINRFVIEALFTTVTNVNFDADRIEAWVRQAAGVRDRARALYEETLGRAGRRAERLPEVADWTPATTREGLLAQAERVGTERRREELGEDRAALVDLLTFGLKGMAAYADHAAILGVEDPAVYDFFHEALDLAADPPGEPDRIWAMILRCGEVNLRVMGMLDEAHTRTYGSPRPTPVRITPVKGKAILVSGHDLKDLEELLKQTENRGVNVYTHGEMLPAHGYPGLKRFRHLVGNYGGAWQDQAREFDAFPGAILMTTNCLQRPRESYAGRLFTCGLVGWPGIPHITDRNFEPVIRAALEAPGFERDEPERTVWVGFGHHAVAAVADRIINAVRTGAVRHFFLIGGCDGAKPGRNYYTRFAEAVPEDCIILTLACGKYRFNKRDFGTVAGLPRLLDVGQCNDAYSAIRIAQALAEAFGTDVNHLPLSLVLSWYEQKAVCILLTLLYLGFRHIRLGPTLPAFLPPAAVRLLAEKFELKPISTVEADLQAALAGR